MTEDPLDKTTSLGVDLTPTGLTANAKSRFVAAIDRLCGNVVDLGNIPLERRSTRERAKTAGEQQLIEAITKLAIERMGRDEEFAERVTRNYLGSIASKQENKDAVVREAIEDMRRDPIDGYAAKSGQSDLDPLFLNKFERHAEDASTEALREKWGRVLSAEVRKPGTFSPRVMRIVDEIDSETAQLFESICASRLGNCVPVCIYGELEFNDAVKLIGAGLIVDPGLTGQIRQSSEVEFNGSQLWFVAFERQGFALRRDFAVPPTPIPRQAPLTAEQEKPAIPIYVLTNEGYAVSQILPDKQVEAFGRYLDQVRSVAPDAPIISFDRVAGDQWRAR